MNEAALGGVGPDSSIVAFSTLCTHKGCPVAYRPEHRLLICPCHWSSFDPAKAGGLVIGQASQALARIELRIEAGHGGREGGGRTHLRPAHEPHLRAMTRPGIMTHPRATTRA